MKSSIPWRVFIITLIVAFVALGGIFIYQYIQYKKIESRLSSAYSFGNYQSPELYKLFSTFSEADNAFRLYTITFKKENFITYNNKIDSIKVVIDSLASLPIEENPINKNAFSQKEIAVEYIFLKRQMDKIVSYSKDTLQLISDKNKSQNFKSTRPQIITSDSIINRILKDSTKYDQKQDTVVKKKDGLFNRIFRAKDDTLINNTNTELLNVNQIDIIQRNIDHLIVSNEKIYQSNLKNLSEIFKNLQETEQNLLLANISLLNNLKKGIEKLQEIEFKNHQLLQEQDLNSFEKSANNFRQQLIYAFIIMVLMLLLIFNYRYRAYRYELRLIKEKDYAAKIAKEKTNVLANVSHEIRTPINSLKGLVKNIKDNNNQSIDKGLLETIDHDITLVNNTINDILNLSKIESNTFEVKNDKLFPHELLNDVVSLNQYLAQSKGLAFTVNNNIPENISIVNNSFRIRQIISNLITNAIKYTNQGSVHVEAGIKEKQNSNFLIVTVKDTGIGISEEQKHHVFRKYYIADTEKMSGGFGLGLYISKLLSEQINGTINFTSQLGKGSVFTFELPIKEISESKNSNRNLKISDLPADLNMAFIDDSKINLFFVQQLFGKRENITFFHSATQALKHFETHPVDIIITDLKMSEMDGWQLLNQIKSNSDFKNTKVFVWTAELMLLEQVYNQKSAYQFDDIINKPIEEQNLVATVLKHVNTNKD